MSSSDHLSNNERGLATAAPGANTPILARFEDAWRQGERPVLDHYLQGGSCERLALLLALVPVDLRHRLASGEAVRVETYLESYPELRGFPHAVVDLIVTEITSGASGTPVISEYLSRFPQYTDLLTSRLKEATDLPERADHSTREFSADVPPTRSGGESTPGGWSPAANWPRVAGYTIIGELGRGGMGVVYRAVQVQLNRTVALKMMGTGRGAGEPLARFRAEAEAVARLKHPNIVQIFEVGEADGMPFFSLEFVEGGSLDKQIKIAPQGSREAADLTAALAQAMHYAHQQGIVHRDLKPANVLMMKADAGPPQPKIADFGLAKFLDVDQTQTQTGAVLGTPSYMAPEQAAGRIDLIGPATDIYALGAVLYDLLVGRPPFKAATTRETLRQVLDEEPIPPRALQPKVARDLETICLKCLQKDIDKRYTSAELLAADLRRFLHGEPILARPTPTWERMGKWARRKPAVASLIGAVAVAALAFVASMTLYALYAGQQADHFKQQLEVRERSSQDLLQAQEFELKEDWQGANTVLTKVQAALDAQPDLRDDQLRADVRRRLDVVAQKLDHLEQQKRVKQWAVRFQTPYENTRYYRTAFTGTDLAENRIKTLAAARTALADTIDDSTGLPERVHALLERDRPFRDAAEHDRLVSACYELMLIWAETEADTAGDQAGAAKALALLRLIEMMGRPESRTFRLHKARFLALSKGEPFDRAAAELADTTEPVDRFDLFLTALEKYRQGKWANAIADCEKVLAQNDDFWARYVKALCLVRLGQWASAEAGLSACLNLRPGAVWPRLIRGFAVSEMAARHLEDLKSLPAGSPAMATLRKQAEVHFASAKDDFDRSLRQDADPLVQYVGLTNRGVLHVRQRQFPAAVTDLTKAAELIPAGFQASLNLAQALEGMGKRREALGAMDEAIKRAPTLALAYESRARLHFEQNNRTQACDDFREAIRLEPKGSKSIGLVKNLVQLGGLLHRERSYADALAQYDRALRLQPDYALTQRFRAETLLALNQVDEAGDALDAYFDSVKGTPQAGLADAYYVRGLIHAKAGKLGSAIEMYTLALRHYASAANQSEKVTATSIRCQRGWAYFFSDAAALALADFEACLSEEKANFDALIGRGNARVRLKQVDAGIRDAENAEKQAALTDRLSYNLARIYAQSAAYLEAKKQATRGLDRKEEEQLAWHTSKAVHHLRQTLEMLPQERRAAFWRTQVGLDPVFGGVRASTAYRLLSAQYASKE